MTNAMKLAGFGLAAGAAVMLAVAAPATAFGGKGGQGGQGGPAAGAMGGDKGGVFAVQFTDLDADGDGLVTEAELAARAEALVADRLAEVDADGDGTVTAEELEAQITARIGQRMGGLMAGKGQRGGSSDVDPAERLTSRVAQMIANRDSNEDGVLSGEELSPAGDIAALIDRFDTDDDNAWSEEEFAQVNIGKSGKGGRGGRGDRGGFDGKRR